MVVDYLSLSEVARRLRKPGHMKLMHYLVQQSDVPAVRVSRCIGIHPDDVPRLREALKRWNERPRVVPVAS